MACNCWTSGPMCCMRQGFDFSASNKPLPNLFTPQGWQCPKCQRVYAPSILECRTCGKGLSTTNEPAYAALYPPTVDLPVERPKDE